MPVRTVPNTTAMYQLISFDANGVERPEPDGSLLSEAIVARLRDANEGITDVFFSSHGWKGDIPAAIEQYDLWVASMLDDAELATERARRANFKALVVGVHWPSLPFGDEKLTSASTPSGGLLGAEEDQALDAAVEEYAASIADTPRARAAIRVILEAERADDGQRRSLPPAVRTAYAQLAAEADVADGSGSPAAPPGLEHEPFDADALYTSAREAAEADADPATAGLLGGGLLDRVKGLIVAPMQQLSFWKMKNRARVVGESGVHDLLVALQTAAAPTTRFHLMGHSFGCIVMSATVAGPPNGTPLPRPVDTLFLVQGALSLWSYANDIPFARGKQGYFHRIVSQGLVRGPIVTTQSSHDTAVGRLYPAAARVKSQFLLGEEFPKYGGVGSYGLQGLGPVGHNVNMHTDRTPYAFAAGAIYNLESSNVINQGGGFSGAHSDIAHPEVASAFWQAVRAS